MEKKRCNKKWKNWEGDLNHWNKGRLIIQRVWTCYKEITVNLVNWFKIEYNILSINKVFISISFWRFMKDFLKYSIENLRKLTNCILEQNDNKLLFRILGQVT